MPPRCGARFIPARAGNTDSWRCYTSVGPVHPRSRGEHIRPARPRGARTGSSPLARGTRMSGRLAVAPVRFIPARAGNTGWGGTGAAGSAVHPRSRGEHSTAAALGLELTGSSPLARGTPHARRRQRRCLRFIPARAGNTCPLVPAHCAASGSSPLARGTLLRPRRWPGARRFIPARAGNTPGDGGRAGVDDGSSPLARGTRAVADGGGVPRRFIPARAGNTRPSILRVVRGPVHPRSRGEHLHDLRGAEVGIGSSPLARGTRRLQCVPADLLRFIPARAGNTGRPTTSTRTTTVHPRSRGEHLEWTPTGNRPAGSSPLARGTRKRDANTVARARFIPARAGNTPNAYSVGQPYPVHPRSRGEHWITSRSVGNQPGSSPLARGTRPRGTALRRLHRFIPARAGNTRIRSTASPPSSVHPRSRGEHVRPLAP